MISLSYACRSDDAFAPEPLTVAADIEPLLFPDCAKGLPVLEQLLSSDLVCQNDEAHGRTEFQKEISEELNGVTCYTNTLPAVTTCNIEPEWHVLSSEEKPLNTDSSVSFAHRSEDDMQSSSSAECLSV